MFAIISNGVIALLVPAGTAFTWDGVQYPANWCNLSTPEEKAAIGMVDVVYGQCHNGHHPQQNNQAPLLRQPLYGCNHSRTISSLEQYFFCFGCHHTLAQT